MVYVVNDAALKLHVIVHKVLTMETPQINWFALLELTALLNSWKHTAFLTIRHLNVRHPDE